MRTFPEVLLAGFLILAGVVFGLVLIGTVKPLPPRAPAAPPANPTVSCQLGQLLIYPTCYNLQRGNVDLNLNIENKFSTPAGEYADIYVVSGAVRITNIYSDEVRTIYAGQQAAIAPFHVVNTIQNGTKLQKRVRF